MFFPHFEAQKERKSYVISIHYSDERTRVVDLSHVFLIFFVVFFGEISCSGLFRESGTKTLRSSTRTIMYDIPEKENNNQLSRRRDCARKPSLKNDKWIFRPTSVEFTHMYSFCSFSARVQWGKTVATQEFLRLRSNVGQINRKVRNHETRWYRAMTRMEGFWEFLEALRAVLVVT